MTTPEPTTPLPEAFGPERQLTVSWHDPKISARAMPNMSGLDFLTAIFEGRLPPPPIFQLMGMRGVEVEPGRVAFALTPDERHYNPIGSVHGGVFCTVLDSAMGCAVHSGLPAGVGYTTLELKTNILRPLNLDSGEVICEGVTVHVGSRTATAEGRMTDARGKLVAHATTTCLILRGERG